ASMTTTSFGIRGLINYQFGEIAKYYREHENVLELIGTSVMNLNQGGRYSTAIEHLFDILDYIDTNKLETDPFTYTKQIDQIISKNISSKEDKRKYAAELSFVKGKLLKSSKPNDAEKEFENAAKEFSKLELFNKHAEAQVEWAELVRNQSLKKSEKLLKEAIESARRGTSQRELGLAQISLAKNNRISAKLNEAKVLEKNGFEVLEASGNKLETAEYYVEMSRIIALTSTNENELKTAVEYATKASKLFDEIDHKYGKTVALFMQGFNRVAKGFREGLSMIKLTSINLKRLRKNDQIEYINSNATYLVDSLATDSDEEVIPVLENTTKNLHPLEEGNLYHLAGILRYQTNNDEGLKLINESIDILKKFVKKNKEYRIFLDVATERAQSMQQSVSGSSQMENKGASTTITDSTQSAGLKSGVKQPKMKTKGGPDLSKK
ncbi:MAG: hypothetical protein ACC656_01585, partial [Candidatus Heimdallarchaeota archaeon]